MKKKIIRGIIIFAVLIVGCVFITWVSSEADRYFKYHKKQEQVNNTNTVEDNQQAPSESSENQVNDSENSNKECTASSHSKMPPDVRLMYNTVTEKYKYCDSSDDCSPTSYDKQSTVNSAWGWYCDNRFQDSWEERPAN